MSLAIAKRAIQGARLQASDRQWFPHWLARYAAWGRVPANADLPVERESVIGFLQFIKAQGKPAWQRLQAVRAMEFYAVHVRRIAAPGLADIAERLEHAARSERTPTEAGESVGVSEFRWPIDPAEPAVVQALRRELRPGGESADTSHWQASGTLFKTYSTVPSGRSRRISS